VRLRTSLEAEYPDRDVRVYEGDCNQKIGEALADLRRDGVAWAPTFAFIDPNGPDCHWATLEALAEHKGPEAKTKVELWMLFPVPLFQRMLPRTGSVRQEDDDRITLMYGTPEWHAILAAKLDGEITATDAREEYVDLMRWRLEKIPGYGWTPQSAGQQRVESTDLLHGLRYRFRSGEEDHAGPVREGGRDLPQDDRAEPGAARTDGARVPRCHGPLQLGRHR
jgi:three-Cys-motif partner protein